VSVERVRVGGAVVWRGAAVAMRIAVVAAGGWMVQDVQWWTPFGKLSKAKSSAVRHRQKIWLHDRGRVVAFVCYVEKGCSGGVDGQPHRGRTKDGNIRDFNLFNIF